MSEGIKAIIFDYGNVLCEPQPDADVQAMADAVSMSLATFKSAYWRWRVTYDRAEVEPRDYWNQLAGRELSADELRRLWDLDNRSWLHPRQAMLGPAARAKEIGLRTALLSNLPVTLRDALEDGSAKWLPKFDVNTYSCSIGVTKPDAAIYEQCVADLGMKPDQVAFLDDRPENVKGANELGIQAVQFETAEQALGELQSRFGISLRVPPLL
ncbi:MAG TPA: HAD family phosphatase [Bryobacteraceae bacterium]|nr:HAD family phosphatase [Bryobacteraceae bacterium]